MKKITSITKEALDGKFVLLQVDSDDYGVGLMHFDPENPQKYCVYQNFRHGSTFGVNNRFECGWTGTEDDTLYELPESMQQKLQERKVMMDTLTRETVIFFNNRFRQLEIFEDGSIYCSGDKLTILHDFVIKTDPTLELSDARMLFYKPILDFPGIVEDYKVSIKEHARQGYAFDGRIRLKDAKNSPEDVILDLSANGRMIRSSLNDNRSTGKHKMFKIPRVIHFGWIPFYLIDEIVNTDFKGSFEETKTLYSTDFIKQVSFITCDEDLKEYMLKGNYYHKMQYITFDPVSQMINYTPKGKEVVFEGNNLTSKNRQSVKVHKFFNTVLKATKAAEYDIKCFADKFIAFFSSYEVKYYRGKKFAENYSRVNTRDWVTKSCMDKKAENFFEMYVCSKFRLGVVYREGEVVGRFIEVTADGGFVYNDRLYYKDETVVAWYNAWVDTQGLNRKELNSYDSKQRFYSAAKGNFTKSITVTLPKQLDSYAIYPYLDTLTYGVGKVLHNTHTDKMRFKFEDQYGKCSRLNCQFDLITQKWIETEYAVQIKFGNHAGEYTTVEHLIYSVKNGGHCLK